MIPASSLWAVAGSYALFAYLLGAIPFGYLIAKKVKGIDIREHGSGNVGSTNVKRIVGKKAGIATQVLDVIKGFIAVLGAQILFHDTRFSDWMPVITTLCVIIGHSKSVFIGFTGGKSVNTTIGSLLALEPVTTIAGALIGIVVMKTTRYVSVGSMVGISAAPVIAFLLHSPTPHIGLFIFIALYVIYLHRSNIQRLLTHQENRI